MKFGSQLKHVIYPEWKNVYLDYDGLKKKLRKAEKENPFSERDETEFVELLDSNLEKVYAFHQEKMEDIRTRTDHWAETIGSQIPAMDNSVEEMGRIQENINDIADDINRLARYSRINYTGFLKIVKKHDRHTNYVLRPMFMVRLNQCPFWNESNDSLLLKLSQLFTQVRQGGKTMSFQQPTLNETIMTPSYDTQQHQQHQQQSRKVVKRFFVQTDNVLELKTLVLRHLPVLVYQDNNNITGKKDNIDPPISTLYLDNINLDTYNSRVESAQGSQIIRLRWYGTANRNNSIAFERRTLAEENSGELRDRFVIKDKYISDFIKGGQAYITKYSSKLRNMTGKTEQDVKDFETLVNQVQQTIMDQTLLPVLRTYYKRTAFQIPGDKRVRMALDTDVCFIREDSGGMFDSKDRRPGDSWRRPDADIQFPFSNLGTDINHHPFATFEIKMDLPIGQDEPEWVKDLQESGILEEAYDFSKFVHGVAVMFDTRVALLPYWLAQMTDDLNQLPSVIKNLQSQDQLKGKGRQPILEDDTPPLPLEVNETTSLLHKNSNNSNDNDNDSNLATSSYTTFPKLNEPEHDHNQSQSNWLTTMMQHIFLHQEPPHAHAPPVLLPPGVKVPKKIITPLRVEPKVFFANERTYFAWMSFGTILATFSIALFNAGDAVGKISGVVYTLVSLSTLIYGMGLYYRRRELIRQRASGPYDDMLGATVICFALLFAVGLNAYLKFSVKSPSLLYF